MARFRALGSKGKAAAAAEKHRQEVTLALIPTLPQLLRRFQTDSDKVGHSLCMDHVASGQAKKALRADPVRGTSAHPPRRCCNGAAIL